MEKTVAQRATFRPSTGYLFPLPAGDDDGHDDDGGQVETKKRDHQKKKWDSVFLKVSC